MDTGEGMGMGMVMVPGMAIVLKRASRKRNRILSTLIHNKMGYKGDRRSKVTHAYILVQFC